MRARGSFTAEAGRRARRSRSCSAGARPAARRRRARGRRRDRRRRRGGELLRHGERGDLGGRAELAAGQPVELVLEWSSRGAVADFQGAKVGCRPPPPADLLERAVAAAAAADAAVVVVGTNDDWETEGRDRASMDLPGDQNELVERVLAANPRTVVVVNAGSPVTLPWADRAPALLDVWFGGPGDGGRARRRAARAPPTRPAGCRRRFPSSLEHNPSHGNFPGENGEVPLRRGRAHRLPLVRGAPAAGPLPVRPRPLLHARSSSGAPRRRDGRERGRRSRST